MSQGLLKDFGGETTDVERGFSLPMDNGTQYVAGLYNDHWLPDKNGFISPSA